MYRKQPSRVACCAAILLLFLLSTGEVSAQSPKQPEETATIQVLLNEVRLLRRTLQQTGLNAYRSHLIVEGVRAHNEKVERVTKLLDEVRNDIEKIGTTIPRMSEQIKVMESMIEQETDQNKRIRLEFEHKDMKRSIEHYKVRQ